MSINNINGNIQYQQAAMGQMPAAADNNLNFQSELERKSAQEASSDKLKQAFENPWVQIGSYVTIFAGLMLGAKGINKNISKGSKSYLGKIGNLGDKISTFFSKNIETMKTKNGKFGKFYDKVADGFKETKETTSNWLKTNKYTSMFFDSSKESSAVNQFANMMRNGVRAQYVMDFDDQIKNLCRVSKGGKIVDAKTGRSIDQAKNITEEAITSLLQDLSVNKKLKGSYESIDDLKMKATSNQEAYEDLLTFWQKIGEKYNLKGAKFKGSNVYSQTMYKKDGKWVVEVFDDAGKATPKDYDSMSGKERLKANWKNFWQKALYRDVYFDGFEYQNKIACGLETYAKETNNSIAKTELGQKLQRFALYTTENFTNGTAGGVCSIAMQVMPLAMIASATIQAEPEDRFKTFMEELFTDLGFFMLLGVQVNIINKLAGLKYVGMTGEQIKNFRQFNNVINTDVAKSGKLSQDLTLVIDDLHKIELKAGTLYKDVIKERKNFLKQCRKNNKWYDKPIQWAGSVANWGRDRIRPMTKHAKINEGGNAALNITKEAGCAVANGVSTFFNYGIPGWVGGLARFGVGMFVISPQVSNALALIPHAIFGTPKNSSYVFGKNEAEKEKERQEQEMASKEQAFQQELLQRIEANPEVLYIAQENPEIMAEIEKDPMVLLALIESVEAEKAKLQKQQDIQQIRQLQSMSPYTNADSTEFSANYDSQVRNEIPQQVSIETSQQQNVKHEPKELKRTYIPSPYPERSNNSEDDERYQKVMQRADAAFLMAQQALR